MVTPLSVLVYLVHWETKLFRGNPASNETADLILGKFATACTAFSSKEQCLAGVLLKHASFSACDKQCFSVKQNHDTVAEERSRSKMGADLQVLLGLAYLQQQKMLLENDKANYLLLSNLHGKTSKNAPFSFPVIGRKSLLPCCPAPARKILWLFSTPVHSISPTHKLA